MSDSNDVYDIGVIGAGKIASSAHLPVLYNIDEARIKYVADVDAKRAKRMGRAYGAQGVSIDDVSSVPECDAALLAIPVTVREPYIEEFGRRGTPVFSEKPFALNPEMHAHFLDQLSDVSCNYLRVCFDSTNKAREIVRSGMFGNVERIVCQEGGIQGATGQSSSGFGAEDEIRDRRLLLDRACHGLSQLLYVFDGGEFAVESSTMKWQRGFDIDVQSELSLHAGGDVIPVDFSLTQVRSIDSVFRIEFENAVVEFDVADPEAQLEIRGDSEPSEPLRLEQNESHASTFAQAAYLRWQSFLRSLSQDDSDELKTGMEITKTMTEMYENAVRSRESV